MIVDAHLDLAYNALDLGRDMGLSLEEARQLNRRTDIPTVTLPALREGGVGIAFATLFSDPTVYTEPQKAHLQALLHLDVYRNWEDRGWVRILRDGADLQRHLSLWPQDGVVGLVILMEGAEPLRRPRDVAMFKAQGVRIIGPSWRKTRYAGGTGEPGGLTELGVELLAEMKTHGVALDLSHLDEQAVADAFEHWSGPVCATHANPHYFLPTNRHLKDDVIKELGQRDGVAGVVLYNAFLQHGWQRGMPRVGLDVVQQHMEYYAALIGWKHIGIGSDMDGGFGLHEMPQGIDQAKDFGLIGNLVPASERAGVLGDNWLLWLKGWY